MPVDTILFLILSIPLIKGGAVNAFSNFFKDLVQRIEQSPRQQPTAVAIAHDHTDLSAEARAPFIPDNHYFQVRVNELYLKVSREWFGKIDPLVFVVSEFVYDKEMRTVPFVVGPALVKKEGVAVAEDTLLRDTRVAGLHPYRGGRICLTVVLCQTLIKNYATNLLKVIERTAGALDYGTMLNPYLKIASVVLDGVEALFDAGDTIPLAALRKEFDPAADDFLTPAYFVLIDAPNTDPQQLWVRKGELLYGSSPAAAKPFRSADFVLYSLVRPGDNRRTDLELLPFYPLWERAQTEASKPSEDHYKSAKANMLSLYETLLLSPDLTREHALKLADEYAVTLQELHRRAVRFSSLGESKARTAGEDTMDDARRRALAAIQL